MVDRDAVRRMGAVVESIATVTFGKRPTEAFLALGLRNYWDGYFAGRAAPLGTAPAEVVHAALHNFAESEVARHIPWVWTRITPAEALAVRERASAGVLRDRLGASADSAEIPRLADLAARAAGSAPMEGLPLYAGLRSVTVPSDPVARLWHAANMLREHRGDCHKCVLVAHRVGGTESHVLFALDRGETPEEFSRTHHLPPGQLAAVVEGLKRRGLVAPDGGFTDEGRALRHRMEDITDDLAAQAYEVLSDDELSELVAGLEPIAAAV